MKIILLGLLLLIIPLAYADIYEDQVFSGAVYTGGTYETSEGEEFTATILIEEAKVILRLPSASLVVENQSCTSNSYYYACVEGMSFSHYNYSLPSREVYTASLTISAAITEVSMNHTISPKELLVNEKSNFSLIIKNEGTVKAENVVLEQEFSEIIDVFLLSGSDCELNHGVLEWKGDIDPAQRKFCYALLQANSPGSASSATNVDYYVRGAKKSIAGAETITVLDYPLTIISNITKNLSIGEEALLSYNISTDSENLTVTSLKITLSDGLFGIRSSGIEEKEKNVYELIGVFETGDEKIFNITVRAEGTGKQTVKADARVVVRSIIQTYSIVDNITIDVGKPKLSLTDTDFGPGENELAVLINNPTNYQFKNLKLKAEGLSVEEAYFETLDDLGHQLAKIPFTAQQGEHNVTLLLTYESIYGEEFQQSAEATVIVTEGDAESTSEQEQVTEGATYDYEEEGLSDSVKYGAIGGAVALIIIAFIVAKKKKPHVL
ncbi:hypothetical protein JXB11_04945 [Candidatus Woesearchaeota archaeon]|nr:hypothetical protein [Candidatus Woesearchaeota archaeon]